MKIKLASFFIDLGNQKFNKMGKLCEEINKKYCELHNYELNFDYIDKQVLINLYGQCTGKEMSYYKITYIKEKLNKQDCDYLVLLDGDATISNPNIKIEDLIDDKHQLFLSRGTQKVLQINCLVNIAQKLNQIFQREQSEHYVTKNYYDQVIMKQYDLYGDFNRLSNEYIMLNEGFMIIKNTPTMRKFWEECEYLELNYMLDRDPKGVMVTDGSSIDFMLIQKRYKDLFTFMYDQAQGGLANSYETAYDVEKTFILHNYGQALTTDQKIDWIQSLKTNKWWKEYF